MQKIKYLLEDICFYLNKFFKERKFFLPRLYLYASFIMTFVLSYDKNLATESLFIRFIVAFLGVAILIASAWSLADSTSAKKLECLCDEDTKDDLLDCLKNTKGLNEIQHKLIEFAITDFPEMMIDDKDFNKIMYEQTQNVEYANGTAPMINSNTKIQFLKTFKRKCDEQIEEVIKELASQEY